MANSNSSTNKRERDDEHPAADQLQSKRTKNNEENRPNEKGNNAEAGLSDSIHGETPPHMASFTDNPTATDSTNEKKGNKKDNLPIAQWGCEYCKRAVFDTYEEADDHEKTCSERSELDKEENRKEIPDDIKSDSIQNNTQNDTRVMKNQLRIEGNGKIQWVCDYCEETQFESYEQAATHEFTCKFNPNNNDDTQRKKEIKPLQTPLLNPSSTSTTTTSTSTTDENSNDSSQESLKWMCVHCEKAIFPSYHEAADHEAGCPDRP